MTSKGRSLCPARCARRSASRPAIGFVSCGRRMVRSGSRRGNGGASSTLARANAFSVGEAGLDLDKAIDEAHHGGGGGARSTQPRQAARMIGLDTNVSAPLFVEDDPAQARTRAALRDAAATRRALRREFGRARRVRLDAGAEAASGIGPRSRA